MSYGRGTTYNDLDWQEQRGQQAFGGNVKAALGGLIKTDNPMIKGVLDLAGNMVIIPAVEWLRPKVGTFAERAAPMVGITSPGARAKVKNVAEQTVRFGLIFSQQIGNVVQTGRDTYANYSQLHEAVEPVLKANAKKSLIGFKSLLHSDNAVISNAMHTRVWRPFKSNFVSDVIEALPTIPMIMGTQYAEEYRNRLKTERPSEAALHEVAGSDDHSGNPDILSLKNDIEGMVARRKSGAGRTIDDVLKDKAFIEKNGMFITSTISQLASAGLGQQNNKRTNQPTALDMIVGLNDQIQRKFADADDEDERGAQRGRQGGFNPNIDTHQLRDHIVKVFQQHQIDSGYKQINDRMEMRALRHAAERIAEAITDEDRQLNPLALVNLVDKGITTKGGRAVLSEAEIDKNIAEQVKILSLRQKVDPKEAYKEGGFTHDDLVETLKNTTEPQARAFLAMITPTELLEDAGMKREEIRELRSNEAKRLLEPMLTKAVLDLSGKSDEELKTKHHLSDEQAEFIKSLAIRMDEEGRDALLASLGGGKGQGLEGLIRKAGMSDKAENYWQKLVGRDEASRRPVPAREEEGQEAPSLHR